MDDEDEVIRRRIRAARALAGVTLQQLADRLGRGLGFKTLGAIERGERGVNERELAAIAHACGVPTWFLLHGLDGATGEVDAPLAERVEALESELGTLRGQHRELRDMRAKLDQVDEDLRAVLRMASQWPTATPPGAQPPAPQASRSTGTTPERSERQEEEASGPDTGR